MTIDESAQGERRPRDASTVLRARRPRESERDFIIRVFEAMEGRPATAQEIAEIDEELGLA